MNKRDALNEELYKNKVDKCVMEAELDKAKRTFADDLLRQYKTIGARNFNQTFVVKKKGSARWRDFIDKIKKVFGLGKRESEEGWNLDIYTD